LAMMASRVASVFVMLFSVGSNEVMAWQSSSRMAKTRTSPSMIDPIIGTPTGQHHTPSDDPEILPSSRRELLFLIPKMAAATVATATMLPHTCAAAAVPAGMTADAARDQWKRAATVVDDLLQNWSTEKWAAEVGGGDAIRSQLGTQGTTSSLFQIEKAFKVLRDSDYIDDFIEFQETSEEFIDALYQADSLANSSNLKTGSGKQTPPAVFLEQSRDQVVKMQSIAKKLNAMVK
jgi:hypothetical protein